MDSGQFSIEERTFVVETFIKLDCKKYYKLKYEFEKCFGKPAPSLPAAKAMVAKFRGTGSVLNIKRAGGRTQKTIEAIEKVKEIIKSDDGTSTRRAAAQVPVSHMTVHSILRNELNLHPYKYHMHHKIPDACKDRRLEFAEKFTELMKADATVEHFTWFSDEAHFHLDGYINSQNNRRWARENPHAFVERSLHPQRVTVWCGISDRGILGPFFIHDIIDSEMYLKLLQDDVIPQLRQRSMRLRDQYFQQDGARVHTTYPVLEYLNRTFGGKVISNRFTDFFNTGFQWPPYSPDLNPCDFYLWGYLKSKVYANNPQNIADLMHNICVECEKIDEATLHRVIQGFKKRLEQVKKAGGGHIEGKKRERTN